MSKFMMPEISFLTIFPFVRRIALLAFVLLPGCDLGADSGQQGRIVVNESIDGVKFGDDEVAVKQKLGEPSSIGIGDFPGVLYEYNAGKHAGMSIIIYSPTATPSGVFSISVSSPYQGTTMDGVGLGTARSLILQTYGQPSMHSQEDSTSWDRYEFGGFLFLLHYRNDVVESLGIGVKQ
jgi:hypothetical protein